MKQREPIEVNTSENAKLNTSKEPSLPVFIPMSIVRWIMYSCFMIVLIGPFLEHIGPYCCLTGGLILGHFASQLNALINKKA